MDRDLFQGRTGRYHVYRLSEIAVLWKKMTIMIWLTVIVD
jgi:hypothetical protein